LDELLATRDEAKLSATQRALLLNDVWTAFDMSARSGNAKLQLRLARALDRLRMTAAMRELLEDNYSAAVKSNAFAKDFDPAHPETAFLPPDLFDPGGPWVQVGEHTGRGLIAPEHVDGFSGRSAFQVFIRCPGGRQATLEYLQQLNSFPRPGVATTSSSDEGARSNVPPQFPEGTAFALVRRMMVIDQGFAPVVTPITQTVQFRVYKRVHRAPGASRGSFDQEQSVYKFVARRKELIAGIAGGFKVVGPNEREFQALVQTNDGSAPVVMRTCAYCHAGTDISSVISYTGGFGDRPPNRQLLPTNYVESQSTATAAWKQTQFNWGLLRGILTADAQ